MASGFVVYGMPVVSLLLSLALFLVWFCSVLMFVLAKFFFFLLLLFLSYLSSKERQKGRRSGMGMEVGEELERTEG